MNKTLVFDMDGTITDLYGVPDWLKMLRNEDSTPYEIAKPLYDVDTLNVVLETLKAEGWKVVVTSWLSKNSSAEYDKKVTTAKINWLKRFSFPYDEVNIVTYGTPKTLCTEKIGGFQILVDDNEEVRNSWTLGRTIDASKNIINKLIDLI